MSKYVLMRGTFYEVGDDELMHYGVKGMKWGVRKDEYKAMNRQQRKKLQDDYFNTEAGRAAMKRLNKNTTIGTFLGGPLGAAIAGFSTLNNISKNVPAAKTITDGKSTVSKNASKKVSELAERTESKYVASIKSRVTGKKENGKPAFLMSKAEMEEFRKSYDAHRKTILDQYNSTSDSATKNELVSRLDRLENDYLNVVEQGFWYSDDF